MFYTQSGVHILYLVRILYPVRSPWSAVRSLSFILTAYNLLCGQVKDVLRDQQSFSQTYKSIEIVKNIDRDAWLQRRNKVLTAVVDGISDGKKSNFQKCVAVEHLYSLADSDQSVLPFSFLLNLLCCLLSLIQGLH